MARQPTSSKTFMPDFCTRESLLVVIVIAELLTLVLTMTRGGTFESLLNYFAVLSLFMNVSSSPCGDARIRARSRARSRSGVFRE